MSEAPSSRRNENDAAGPSPQEVRSEDVESTSRPADHDLEALRLLLLAPEQANLAEIQERLNELESREADVEEISRHLPDAVVLRARKDHQLSRAMAPMMEETLRTSIQQNPRPLADALFPIIGPAIRKSIQEALRSVMEAVNRTVEHSLSFNSLRWRLEALRTGRSFSEIVLAHTLRYRVEQIFLIDKETGLPFQHVMAEAVDAQDTALVTGMLTAIQDFAEHSLGTDAEDTLHTMEIGDLTVLIEEGPEAALAAVIRGIPSPEVREVLAEILESIHLHFKPELRSFTGDQESLEGTRPMLERALMAQYKEKSKGPRLAVRLFGIILLGLLLFWLFTHLRDRSAWNGYLASLNAEPGIVVTDHGRSGGKWFVRGLRDPLAAQPTSLLASSGMDTADVNSTWEWYQALDSTFIVQRALTVLNPPESVSLQYRDGTLSASGTAPRAWRAEARERARFLAGVIAFDDRALMLQARRQFEQEAQRLEDMNLRFQEASTQLLAGQEAVLDSLVATTLRMHALAKASETTYLLQINGHNSTEGSPEINQRISQQRAESVRNALIMQGLPPDLVIAQGTGRPSRVAEEHSEADRAANRSVSFRVVIEDG